MEKAFLEKKLTDNGFQDPMGNDAHQGLERFLDRFHQPTVPSHTIITDPEYYVFLWFHDANGNLIWCPYTDWLNYTPKLSESSVEFSTVNKSFYNQPGIQSGTDNTSLPDKCLDLTPFVREATLPDIAPAGAEDIQTLFGATSAGAFSPYASDGKKSITLSMVDTEYCILDAIFYPWMKDINSPWWYRPEMVYTEWATPYPMATLEIQRPRMRYRKNATPQESRKDADYTYYSYKFIGVKPNSYNAFEINGGGRSNLLRSLTLTSDMCLVDLTGDVAGSSSSSVNLGNRTKLIFEPLPGQADDSPDVPDQEDPDKTKADLDDASKELDSAKDDQTDNQNDIGQQDAGDMPGDDEPDWSDGDRNPNEYADGYGDNDPNQPADMSHDDPEVEGEKLLADSPSSPKNDRDELWDRMNKPPDDGDDDEDDPNGDLDNEENDKKAEFSQEPTQEEKGLFGKVLDKVKTLGKNVANSAKKAAGAVADTVNNAAGLAKKAVGKAVGTAVSTAANAAKSLFSSMFGGGSSSKKSIGGEMASRATTDSEFGSLSEILSDYHNSSATAFGILVNNNTEGQDMADGDGVIRTELTEWTPYFAGTLGNNMKVSFDSIFWWMGNCANILGGSLLNAQYGESELVRQGGLAQSKDAMGEFSRVETMIGQLNYAQEDLVDGMKLMEDLAKSVLSVGYAIGGFGRLVERIVSASSGIPSPLHTYVELVTEDDEEDEEDEED